MNLNWMSVYVLYDVVLIFVNGVVCDWDYPCYCILTLLVIGIIDDDDLVVRVKRGSHPDSTSHWIHRWRWLGGGSRSRFIWLRKNRLDQIIWINRFTWLRYGVKKNWSDQIMWVKGFIWPCYGVKKNRLDRIIWIKFIWLHYGVKKNRLDQIIWVSHVCHVNDIVMYEMNYKNLICCLVEIEIQFMKIQFFKTL